MRLLGLRLRASLGWGDHPTALRWRSTVYMKAFTLGYIPFALLFPLVIVVVDLLPYIQTHHALPSRVPPDLVRYILFSEILLWLGGIVSFLLPALTSRLLARRGEASQISHVYGRCFAVLLAPPSRLFARIGTSRETARWYRFPLAWDRVVAPSEDQLEVDVLEATGWVERVRRTGGVPGEMSHPPPTDEEQRETPTRRATPDEIREAREEMRCEQRGDASEEERMELRRYARRASLGACQTPRQIALNAWCLVLGGIWLGPTWPVVFIVIVVFFPRSFHHSASDAVGYAALAVLTIVGLSLIWYGVKLIRLSRRLRRLSKAPPESMAGEILCWTPYRDWWSPSARERREHGETLIKLSALDGSERIFRVPIRYLHRVRQRGAWVRVSYQSVSERVLDVAYVEEPVKAACVDAPVPD